ncbi:MAG: T9SS type A sorting domain-containing protein [Vicingaceae bacterium]|nr:T9SS type A sorting domain-containing protein [Vicingaceae bacterium]
MKKLLTIFLLLFTATVFATHNRAGEITYTHISGLTYEITATVYVDANSPSNRPFLGFRVCGGNLDSIPLTSSVVINTTTLKNTYVAQHTFPGSSPSFCELVIEDPNRNSGIQNIPNSINIVFYIESELLINPFLGINNSPVFLVQNSVDTACLNVVNYFNYGGADADGDSLYYTLQPSKAQGGVSVPGYFLPPASNSFSLNNFTGELTWDMPTFVGLHNFVVRVEEFRNGQKIGSVDREIQIDVKSSCSTVGINNKEKKEFFQLYPNPANNKITLTSDEKIASSALNLMHYDGAIVPVKIRYHAHSIELDLTELNSGIYMLTGQINTTFISKKIIKQ